MIGKRRRQRALLAKIAAAQQDAQAVGKAGHNADANFKFSRFEDVLAQGKLLCAKHNLTYTSEVIEETVTLGRKGCLAKTVIAFTVIDLEHGGERTFRWVGTGDDVPGGKAVFKAQTGTEKYFVARVFQIPFGEDPEEGGEGSTILEIPTEAPDDSGAADADRIRRDQDAAAEGPQIAPRHSKPLPQTDLPEPDWDGLAKPGEPAGV